MSDAIRVMIVDDERLFAELLRVALRGADDIDVVAVAHDVRSAIAALDEARPDVVLADYHLPDGTGADLARAVRSSPRQTAIVVLTGDPSAFTLADVISLLERRPDLASINADVEQKAVRWNCAGR